MKTLISTLFLPIVIFLKLGELNAAEKEAISSAYDWERPGLHRRAVGPRGTGQSLVPRVQRPVEPLESHIEKTVFMNRNIRLRIAGGKVVQASMANNHLPDSPEFYKKYFFIIRLAKIEGHDTVIYVNQIGRLMGIRPPHPNGAELMEPNETTWFISYDGQWLKARVNPDPNPEVQEKPAVGIELMSGNSIKPNDIIGKVTFPWITFNVHRVSPRSLITAATLPPQRPPPHAQPSIS